MMKLLKQLFPFKDSLYLLQQEQYYTGRFFSQVFSNPFKRNWQSRQALIITLKIRVLIVISLIIFVGVIIGVYAITSSAVVSIIVGVALCVCIPIIIGLANLILFPLDYISKKLLFKKARKKIDSLKNTNIIGITGSFGKSTTRHIITELLTHQYTVLTPPKNYNVDVSVARFILDITEPPDYLVLEMGMYYKGDIQKLCTIAPPDIAIITGIGTQHIERLGSLQAIAEAKSEIITYAKPHATIVLSDAIEDKAFLLSKTQSRTVVWYGTQPTSPYHVHDIRHEHLLSVSTITHEDTQHTITSHFLGTHNMTNIAGALAVADLCNIPLEKSTTWLRDIQPLERRMNIQTVNDMVVINDSYNINPQSARLALETAVDIAQKKRLVVVTGGIPEQGVYSEKENTAWGALLGTHAQLVIVSQSKYAPFVEAGIHTISPDAATIVRSSDPTHTVSLLKTHLRSGDVVLIQNELPDIYH